MDYIELTRLYFERSAALQSYWTLYVVIIGGLLAFSSFRTRKDRLITLLVSILYIFFAYKNLGAIRDTTAERFAILQSMKQTPGYTDSPASVQLRGNVEPVLTPPVYKNARNFHVITDILVIVAVWAKERRRESDFQYPPTSVPQSN